jgi:hypothetical protein
VVSLVRAAIEIDFDGHEVFNAFGPDSFPRSRDDNSHRGRLRLPLGDVRLVR